MARINTKLNLNKTPNTVDNNSLIFAKNIRLDVNGDIHRDYGITPMTLLPINSDGKIVEYSYLLTRVLSDLRDYTNIEENFVFEYYKDTIEIIENILYNGVFKILGIIPDSNDFYLFCGGIVNEEQDNEEQDNEEEQKEKFVTKYFILKYSEKEDRFTRCNCNWTWASGEITGCVITNLIGEKILNIGESYNGDNLVPFKCINLSKSSYTDDETLYTQTPNIPIINLNYGGNFSYVIPNGVYQFFVRYKIRDDFYTDWFPASKELFAGNTNSIFTNFGTLRYNNINSDATNSFSFNVESLYKEYESNYESFQIGFILSHDDAIYARAWKHFSFNQTFINFDYNAEDAEEIEVTDLTKPSYQIFNVGNVTSFKNKLYISNYIETDFNEDLQQYADTVKITLNTEESTTGYGEYDVIEASVYNTKCISGLKINDKDVMFVGENGIIHKLITTVGTFDHSAHSVITNVCTETGLNNKGGIIGASLYDFTIYGNGESLTTVKNNKIKSLESRNNYKGIEEANDNVTKVILDGIDITKDCVTESIQNNVVNVDKIIEKLYNSIEYLTYSGNFTDIKLSNKSSFVLEVYRKIRYRREEYTQGFLENITPLAQQPSIGTPTISIATEEYKQTVTINITANKNLIHFANITNLINKTTLIPYQRYKFYIHYVKQSGETTNGYYCGGANAGELECPYEDEANKIIYPTFEDIEIPDGYVACFFSILHSSVQSSCVFDIRKGINDSIEGSCVEINTKLLSYGDTITCKQKVSDNNNVLLSGTYHYSGDSSIPRYFGCDGIISFDNSVNEDVDPSKLLYAVNEYETQQHKDVQLIKCTPYIKKNRNNNNDYKDNVSELKVSSYTYDNDLNLLGYICEYSPVDRQRALEYYSDGNNVYKKSAGSTTDTSNNNLIVSFTELGQYNDSEFKVKEFGIIKTNIVKVYSNYNLNYMNLVEDVKTSIKSYFNKDEGSTNTDKGSTSILWRLLASLTLCEVYTLSSMYKLYTRKVYSAYYEDAVTTFDNTVRSSELIGDESKISIFKFDVDDYYNVPTNRGKIVNMLSIGDSILVHTEDSMFRFTGSNNLVGSTGEIVTNETEPFNTGIGEIFGSDFGFAGLQNKKEAIVTENGYIFFDRDAKIFYMYSGQNRIDKISDDIEKLFDYDKIADVSFANDFYNNRFFVCIVFENNQKVTLSYNMTDKNKGFVSLHDFCFTKAFNTKTNCYFITHDDNNICVINKNKLGCYEQLENTIDTIYPIKFNEVSQKRYSNKNYYVEKDTIFYNTSSIVDVIINDNYEIVKTLNNIEWCSRFIGDNFKEIINDDIKTLLVAEPETKEYPCSSIRIYTDTCATDIINCNKIANNSSITDPNSYKYPRFNQGKWNLNHFRNILNSTDIFGYLSDKAKDKENKPTYKDSRDYGNNTQYRSDNNSLIEGKYFVIRFIFDGSDNSEINSNDFRLETLSVNTKEKL